MTLSLLTTAPSSAHSAVYEAIVVSADALFTAEGVTTVPLERVAAGADVSVAAVEEAFPTWHQLVVAPLQYRHQDWMAALLRAESAVEHPCDKILTVFSYLEQCFADHSYRGCAFINGYGELGRIDPLVARLADEHLQQCEQHIAMLCDAAELPTHLAPALTLLLQGAQVEAAVHRAVQPARTARRAAVMLIAVYDQTYSAKVA